MARRPFQIKTDFGTLKPILQITKNISIIFPLSRGRGVKGPKTARILKYIAIIKEK
jgi:hypothetical protein